MRAVTLLAAWAWVAGCASGPCPSTAATAMSSTASPQSAALHALFASEWDVEMQEWPTRASSLGDRRHDDRWPDVSPAGFARRAAHARELQARVHAIDPAPLSPDDRLSLELFTREVDVEVEGEPYRLWHILIDQRDGIQTADDLGRALRFATTADYDAWITRLRAVPAYVDGAIATLREGTREHIVQPRVVMERVPAQIAQQVVSNPEQSPFFHPLRSFPASIPQADRDRILQAARAAIAEAVVPAYRRLGEYFSGEYLPACLPDVGAWQLPHGAEAYAYLARMHTTTKMTPEQIHDVGLHEVARIRGEMLALMARVGFKGTLPDFFTWLRTDPQFFYADGRSLFAAYEAMSKRIEIGRASCRERV